MKNERIIEYSKFAVIMVGIYTFFDVTGIGCPIKFLTGISCVGCGMTRAWISLIHLDIKNAFHYHPLFFIPIIYVMLFVFKDKIPKKIFMLITTIGIILFGVVYMYRIFNPDDVVNINISKGIIFKFVNCIKNGGY